MVLGVVFLKGINVLAPTRKGNLVYGLIIFNSRFLLWVKITWINYKYRVSNWNCFRLLQGVSVRRLVSWHVIPRPFHPNFIGINKRCFIQFWKHRNKMRLFRWLLKLFRTSRLCNSINYVYEFVWMLKVPFAPFYLRLTLFRDFYKCTKIKMLLPIPVNVTCFFC